MGALDRFVDILRLFDERKSDWTIQDMAEATGVAASTVYRTVRVLVSEGFLDPSTEAHYRLGAIFIEFDRRMRLSDPLIREGAPVLADLLSMVSVPCAAIIARLYRDQVICVADDRNGSLVIPTSYERGRPMPLLQGATSKAILAQLPRARLARIFRAAAIADNALDAIAGELGAIRRRGYTVTRGEVDKGLVGVSVPIACPQVAINASISLILAEADLDETLERRLLMTLVPAADMLSRTLSPGLPKPPIAKL
jgi:DNA-binding IclR family transcriptional regulator